MSAKNGKKNGKPNLVGRPTRYKKEFERQAYGLCLLGATDEDMARFFEVTETTINNWKIAHPEFLVSLRAGKEEADANVANRLYQRAMGWEHDAVKIVADAKTGAEHSVPYIERYPPDVTACIFWLKNRRPDVWRDKHDHHHSGKIEGGVLRVPAETDAKAWEAGAGAQQAVNRVSGNGHA